MVTQLGAGKYLGVRHAPYPKGAGAQRSPIFGTHTDTHAV